MMASNNSNDAFSTTALAVDTLSDWLNPSSPRPVVTACLLIVIALLYWLLLPNPISTIPGNPHSAFKPLGDLPSLVRHTSATGETATWLLAQCQTLNSPIVQVHLRRDSYIILSDHREIEDILVRRAADFDRAPLFAVFFRYLVPHSTIVMPTHEGFRHQRRLWSASMTSTFLQDVAAPYVHDSALALVKLWTRKAELARDRPFEAYHDIRLATLDLIWATSTGMKLESVRRQLAMVDSVRDIDDILPTDRDAPVQMPRAPLAPMAISVFALLKSNGMFLRSAVPLVRRFITRQTAWFKTANAMKEDTLGAVIAEAQQRSTRVRVGRRMVTSALDMVFQRRAEDAERAGLAIPQAVGGADERAMKDELLLFVMAVSPYAALPQPITH